MLFDIIWTVWTVICWIVVYILQVRKLISDFAIILAILIFCCVDALVGVDTPKLIVPSEFKVCVCVCVEWVSVFVRALLCYSNPVIVPKHSLKSDT